MKIQFLESYSDLPGANELMEYTTSCLMAMDFSWKTRICLSYVANTNVPCMLMTWRCRSQGRQAVAGIPLGHHTYSCVPLRPSPILEQLEHLRSEIPPAPPWLPKLLIHIRYHITTRQSQSYKFKKFAKNSNFGILQEPLHTTHLLKLLNKMCKYIMDLASIVEDTERTGFCPRTDGRSETNIPP